MLNRNVTWGDLRAMVNMAPEGVTLSENPLNDLDFREATKDIPDDQYYFDVSPEEAAEWDAHAAHANEKLYLTTDDDRNVLGLIREEVGEGNLFIRKDGDWVPVLPQDDVPELDDRALHQVFNPDIVSDWDSKQGQPLSLAMFTPYL